MGTYIHNDHQGPDMIMGAPAQVTSYWDIIVRAGFETRLETTSTQNPEFSRLKTLEPVIISCSRFLNQNLAWKTNYIPKSAGYNSIF